jgi:putative FmdB family regulatory protein
MPTYDYRCSACEHEFELVQSMRAPVKRKCPQCSKLKLDRLIGIGAGFIIKGGAASVKAEAAEKAADEKAVQKAAKKSKDNSKKSDMKSTKPGSGRDAPAKKVDAKPSAPSEKASEPSEKKISGSTSTPTHRAREGRGVGNLVDAARRKAKIRKKPAVRKSASKKSARKKSPKKS